jgi:hypothetical protein
MEQFEILYMSQQHMRQFCYMDLMVFDQGPLKFEVLWGDELTNLTINDDDIANIGISGSCIITGPMIVLLKKDIPGIEEIVFRLYTTVSQSPIIEVPLSKVLEQSVLKWKTIIPIK